MCMWAASCIGMRLCGKQAGRQTIGALYQDSSPSSQLCVAAAACRARCLKEGMQSSDPPCCLAASYSRVTSWNFPALMQALGDARKAAEGKPCVATSWFAT
jgi:glyoxylate carboligase